MSKYESTPRILPVLLTSLRLKDNCIGNPAPRARSKPDNIPGKDLIFAIRRIARFFTGGASRSGFESLPKRHGESTFPIRERRQRLSITRIAEEPPRPQAKPGRRFRNHISRSIPTHFV